MCAILRYALHMDAIVPTSRRSATLTRSLGADCTCTSRSYSGLDSTPKKAFLIPTLETPRAVFTRKSATYVGSLRQEDYMLYVRDLSGSRASLVRGAGKKTGFFRFEAVVKL